MDARWLSGLAHGVGLPLVVLGTAIPKFGLQTFAVLYLLEVAELDTWVALNVNTMLSFAPLVAPVLAGLLVAAVGPYAMMGLSCLALAVASGGLAALGPTVPVPVLIGLFGTVESAYHGVWLSVLTAAVFQVPQDLGPRRLPLLAGAFGVLVGMTQLGALLGPLAGAWTTVVGFEPVFAGFAAVGALAVPISAGLAVVGQRIPWPSGNPLVTTRNPIAIGLAGAAVVLIGILSQWSTWGISTWMNQGMSPELLGWVSGGAQVVGLVGAGGMVLLWAGLAWFARPAASAGVVGVLCLGFAATSLLGTSVMTDLVGTAGLLAALGGSSLGWALLVPPLYAYLTVGTDGMHWRLVPLVLLIAGVVRAASTMLVAAAFAVGFQEAVVLVSAFLLAVVGMVGGGLGIVFRDPPLVER